MLSWIKENKEEFKFCTYAFVCLVVFCGMGTVCQNKWPLFNTVAYHWDKANALRDVFLSFLYGLIALFISISTNRYVVFSCIAVFCMGIFFTDMSDKIKHYYNLQYDVSKITKTDITGFFLTGLFTYFQYIYATDKKRTA